MKRKFTKLIAALALLVFMTPTMVGWGQTRTTQTASYGFETGDNGWTATSFVTNNTAITAHGGSKYGATNGGSSADVQYNTIVASPQSLTCYYSKTTTNTNAGSKFLIQVSSNNSTWTTVATGLGMDQVTKGTWYELTADLSSYSNVYVRVRYDGTSAVRALDDITLTYDDGQSPSTDPEITFNPTSISLGEVLVGNQVTTTFSVSQANLTSGITLSVDNGSLSPSSIAQGAAATTVTWTYTPTTAGAISATVTATSGTTTETLAISGTAIAPVEGYDVDFEYATDMYPNWTFDNMTTYQTGSITAHSGTYYGTTGGKATASITTESTVANPGTLTCYVSKQSGNTTSSTWYIQVSENGSTWTDVESHSATSMSQGSWVEFTADLSSYSNVYVRVYYSGSTAIRNIDDLTLTTVEPSAAVATTTTINVPANFNTDIYQGTTAGTLTATVTETESGDAVSGATVTWSSSNTGVATIDANGAVTLVAVGTTTITASYAGVEDEYRPSTGTYELTVTDSNAPGTQNNPYTVAQAIAATPSNGNVYIQGIVSSFYNTSIVGDGSNYRYYISDDGTTTTQLLVYKGKGLNQATFTSADDLLVGDEVVIYGTLITYQSAPEVASGNYLYSWNRPTHPIINANDINLTYDATSGSIAYSITNPTSATLTATSNADWISNITVNAESVTFTTTANESDADRTATITLSYTGATDKVINVTQAHYVPDYATLPFEFDGGNADIENTVGLTQNGIDNSDYSSSPKLKFKTEGCYLILKINETPGELTFDIKGNSMSGSYEFSVMTSTDGITYETNTSYTSISGSTESKTINNLASDVRYIKWVYTTKDQGNVGLGNIKLAAYTAPTPTITLNSYEINAPAAATDGTLTVTYTEIETGVGVDIIWCDENGDVLTDQTEYESWLLAVFVTGDINTIEYTIEANDGAARTAYFKVYGVDGGANDVYSNLVTIAQAASGPAPATYTLINNVNNLVSGKRYIIASGTDGSVQAMGSQSTNNRAAVTVTAASNVITWDEGVYEVVIIGPDVEGCYTIYDVTNAQYLYAAGTGSSNHLKTQENINDRARWTISFSGDAAAITSITTATDRNVIRYNSSSTCFSCYAEGGQKSIYLFAKDNETTVSYKKSDIASYGNSQRGGYYLIASPVGQVTPTDGNGFLTNNYDLYAFDQSAANAKVWRNYEAVAFNLVSGRGYLYANSGTTTELTFEGMPYVGKGQVILSYDGNSDWAGWNLIGNPYATNATIPNNQSYYTLNTDRDELIAGESTTIGAMEGIFVKATAAGQSVTFTPTRGNKGEANLNSRVVLNLNGDHGVIDRAIVRFSEGGVLPKFMMNPENTRIYIRQGNEDFAVLNSEAQGEMPVNFKAATDGTYTISVEAENLDVNYLHLIDNKTGMDIDLLQTPSYTFEGKRTDYASRFRLVFSANDNENESDNENFAFISDGQIIVSGAQNATVQVVDMLGRVVVSRNNVNTVSTEGIVPGVYVIRVIDGENVRAQKIVVR